MGSNSKDMRKIFENEVEVADGSNSTHQVTKVLGIVCDQVEDMIAVPVTNLTDQGMLQQKTKGAVLQTTAKLYDPLGYISPFSVRAKIGVQKMWTRNQEG